MCREPCLPPWPDAPEGGPHTSTGHQLSVTLNETAWSQKLHNLPAVWRVESSLSLSFPTLPLEWSWDSGSPWMKAPHTVSGAQ